MEEGLLCPACGYDLRGTEGERCSECGAVIDRAALLVSGFPWARRREIGRVWAYLKTVWLVTIGSRLLRNEASKPQDPREARVFRWVTAGILGVTLVASFVAVVIGDGGVQFLAVRPTWQPTARQVANPAWLQDVLVPWCAGATIPAVLPAALVMLAVYLTGSQRALFRRRNVSSERQDRLEVIGCYSIAPMLWLLPGVVCIEVGYWVSALVNTSSETHYSLILLREAIPSETEYALTLLGGMIAAVGILLSPVRIVQWAVRVIHGGVERWMVGAIQLAGLWLMGIVLLLGLVPWCVGFLWIVIDSFR